MRPLRFRARTDNLGCVLSVKGVLVPFDVAVDGVVRDGQSYYELHMVAQDFGRGLIGCGDLGIEVVNFKTESERNEVLLLAVEATLLDHGTRPDRPGVRGPARLHVLDRVWTLADFNY